ncbi:MAG: glycosyltransferase family 2 protein [Prevotellaceae bacterium]|jgi:glycosyltransferase involved in cell wall biosynthesis|nr:glycosyltransferase family 2 protein [Prevotellaceae bacterium]
MMMMMMMMMPGIASEMKALGICVVIPTYNNGRFLADVLDTVLQYAATVVVVNDGSTDHTGEILERYGARVDAVSYPQNRGKGYALGRGFGRAAALGCTCALTMDSDGQHFAGDLPLFVEAAKAHPGAMIVGSRALRQENMPAKNTFANKFSNFWFTVQTGIRLPDTQTGFRLYPLASMKGMRALTSRYEAELELLVRLAWRNVAQIPVPIRVRYHPAGERVSHFRPTADFLRISALNTVLVFLAIIYGYPSRLIRSIL